jgi:hypothetical protein
MNRTILAAVALAAMFSASPTAAIDFATPLAQLDGQPFVAQDGKPITMTLATVAETALLASYQDEQNLSGEDKVKRFVLATKIHGAAKDLPLTSDEVSLVKKLIGKSYNPLIVGQAWRLLDPASVPDAK